MEVVNPLNESFNPELHQAMTLIDSPEAAPNSVIAVMQKVTPYKVVCCALRWWW